MKVKLKWKVDPPPTGRFRCFVKRGWPSATYPDGSSAAYICSTEAYHGSYAQKGVELAFPLTIRIAFHHPEEEWDEKGAFTWRTMKVRAYSLEEAKTLAQTFIENSANVVMPVKYRETV